MKQLRMHAGWEMAARYLLLLVAGLGNLWIWYFIFTPLTFYPAVWILSLFERVILISGSSFIIGGTQITLVEACIAGAAYYLLFILALATPMKAGKRARVLFFLFGSFLALNILRIVIFSLLRNSHSFDVAHQMVWYFGSTLMLVGLWFGAVKIFRLEAIPLVSDMRELLRGTKR